MANLKSLIKKYDQANMLGSIKLIPEQVQDAWRKTGNMILPADYHNIERILVIGMGGSILGPELIKNILGFNIKKPLELISDYAPAVCNFNIDKTLFILSSYSGNTEEVLSWTKYLTNKQSALKIIGITSGGQLEKWFIKNQKPYYKINVKLNPCAQPRQAVAFSAIALLGFFKKLNLLENNTDSLIINNLIKQNNNLTLQYGGQAIKQFNNSFNNKTTISQIKNRLPIIISAEHLKTNAHILANQINENGKTFAAYFTIPELNHHLLAGLKLPATNGKNLIFIFLESNLYSPKNKLRIKLTKQILKKRQIKYINFNFSSHHQKKINPSKKQDKLAQQTLNEAFDALIWSSYLSFYLALYNQFDPSEISVLEDFKKNLAAG